MILGYVFAPFAPQRGESEPEEKTIQLTADVPLTGFGGYKGGRSDEEDANRMLGINKPGLLVEILPEGDYKLVFIPKPPSFFSPNGPHDDFQALFYEPHEGKRTLRVIFTGLAEENPISPIGGRPASVFIADKGVRLEGPN
jgi:hypothetical protein